MLSCIFHYDLNHFFKYLDSECAWPINTVYATFKTGVKTVDFS